MFEQNRPPYLSVINKLVLFGVLRLLTGILAVIGVFIFPVALMASCAVLWLLSTFFYYVLFRTCLISLFDVLRKFIDGVS